jgi:hypothetical protein
MYERRWNAFNTSPKQDISRKIAQETVNSLLAVAEVVNLAMIDSTIISVLAQMLMF